MGEKLLVLTQYKPPVGAVDQHLELLVQPQANNADCTVRLDIAINLCGLNAEGNVHRLPANIYGEIEELDLVAAEVRVIVKDGAGVCPRRRDGLSDVVRDAGPGIEDHLAFDSRDFHRDDEPGRPVAAKQGILGNGVDYHDVVALVGDHYGLFPVVEQHLVPREILQPPEFVQGRVHEPARPFEMLAQSGDSLHVLFVDVDRAARVDKDALAIVGDDEVAFDEVDVEDLTSAISLI